MLHSSAELFACYNEYYQLFYPQGGSTLPSVVMTESSLTLLAKNSLVDEAQNIGSTPLAGTSSADSGPSEPSDLAAATPVTRATDAVKRLKRKRVPTARPQDSMKVMIGLQNKQLQLERERLRVEREKLACITGIQGELTAIRFTLCHLAGVSFEPVTEE